MPPSLAEALSLFAKTRNPALVPLVSALGAAEDFTPPTARKNADFHRLWLMQAEVPEARTWALKSLMAQLPKVRDDGTEHPAGERLYAVLHRLQALEKVPADPRIEQAVLALLELDPPDFPSWEEVVPRLLERHGDETTEAALLAIEPDFWNPEHAERLGQRSLRFPRAVALTSEERTRFAAPKRTEARPDVEQLWRAVYDAPDDDAPREVLSDFLQEQGDPRGELIALQLREARGQATRAEVERAQALTKAHGKAWLGPLRPIVYRAQLRRGFLWRLELAGSWSAKPKVWEALASHPSLATVEELARGEAITRLMVPFLTSGALRNLRRVSVEDALLRAAVETATLPRLEALDDVDSPKATELATRLERITSVGTGRLDASVLAQQWPKALRERLVRVEHLAELSKSAALWKLLPKLEELRIRFGADLKIQRRDRPARLRVIPSAYLGVLGGLDLKGLPRSIEEIEVVASEAFCKKAAKDYPKLKLIAVPRPSGYITNPKG